MSRPIPGLLRRAGVVALVTSLPLAGCASAPRATALPTSGTGADGWHGTVLSEPYAKPSTTFIATDGSPYRIDRDARRPVVLVTFGYTHCPEVCVRVLADAAAALRGLDPGTRGRVQLLFVTVDPDRDGEAELRSYLHGFDPTFVGLRASTGEVRSVAQSLGVAVAGHQAAGAGYTVAHGAQLVGFGPDGLAHLTWMPGTPVADLRADIVRLASSS